MKKQSMVETWIDFLRISDTMAITNIHMKKAKPDNDTTSYSIQGEVDGSITKNER